MALQILSSSSYFLHSNILIVLVLFLLIDSTQVLGNKSKNKHHQNNHHSFYYTIIPSEFYDKIHEYKSITMYNLIFDSIEFKNSNEACDLVFQNCMLDSNNNQYVNNVHNFSTTTTSASTLTASKNSFIVMVSGECYPLKKAHYCLQRSNFVSAETDCSYGRISDRVRKFLFHVIRNLETCMTRFPYDEIKTRSSLLRNDGKSYYYSQIFNLYSKHFSLGLILLLNNHRIKYLILSYLCISFFVWNYLFIT